MRFLVAGLLCGLVLIGCSGGQETSNKPPEMINPGGQPRTEQEQKIAEGMRKSGESASNRMAQDSQAMREAAKHMGGQ